MVEVVVNPHTHFDNVVVLEMDAKGARALARMLNRHANIIDPRRKNK
jgi:hypothetical protein